MTRRGLPGLLLALLRDVLRRVQGWPQVCAERVFRWVLECHRPLRQGVADGVFVPWCGFCREPWPCREFARLTLWDTRIDR